MRRALLQHGIFGYSQDQIKRFSEDQICQHFDHLAIQCNCLLELEGIRLYNRQIKILEELILGTVVDEPMFDLLQTISGVGNILALTIFYEVGSIERSRSSKQFSSYTRVVPGIAQSGNIGKRRAVATTPPLYSTHTSCPFYTFRVDPV